MTHSTSPAAQLAALPEPVQAELWKVVRSLAGMTPDEKATALAGLTGTAEAFLVLAVGSEKHRPALELFASMGELTQQMHLQTNETKEAV